METLEARESVHAEACELREKLNARADFYRMLKDLYFRALTQDEIDAMAQADYTELRAGKEESLMAEGFDDIFRYLRKRNTGTRQELAADHTGAFLGTRVIAGKQAMPYESLFRDESGLLMRAPRTEVYRMYKQARIMLPEELNVPEDHLAFEFEFMAILCDRAVECLDKGDWQGCADQLALQEEFFQNHIASWFGDFYERALAFVQTRFYRGVLKVTKAYLDEEQASIDEARVQCASGATAARAA
ncbi:molecular chaperone [uncultured Adlercreutzia sp.]|uniref:TorD/DmsD family molecular chaperone n=1 Tax=uncultured Adlercreutzia sp. TaxID=875803 RepID=UPI0025F8C51F|nr:molecular chaperone TorD family protein [uncultured Adlercreutzia sp.]MCI9260957.1 molecular chaperone TorD family protein [Eggerthellaceae bacterium]